jgi:type IV secretory pathway VirJ component
MYRFLSILIFSFLTFFLQPELEAQVSQKPAIQPAQKPFKGIKPKVALLKDLPLLEFPVQGDKPCLAIVLSGNGGWRSLVSSITKYLNTNHVPVIGFNCMSYFSKYKPHDLFARDLEKVISFYTEKYKKSKILFIGYSMGAEVLPFALNHFSIEEMAMIQDVIMIAPSQKCTFHDMIVDHLVDRRRGEFIVPEIQRSGYRKFLIICDNGPFALCRKDLPVYTETITLGGGHHIGKNYALLSKTIGKRLLFDK